MLTYIIPSPWHDCVAAASHTCSSVLNDASVLMSVCAHRSPISALCVYGSGSSIHTAMAIVVVELSRQLCFSS